MPFQKFLLFCLMLSIALPSQGQKKGLENAIKKGKNASYEYAAHFKKLNINKEKNIREWCHKKGYRIIDIRSFSKERFGGTVQRFISSVRFISHDDADYLSAKKKHKSESYITYLQNYKNGAHEEEAHKGLVAATRTISKCAEYAKKFENIKGELENKAYHLAETKSTPESYSDFMVYFPQSQLYSRAGDKLCSTVSNITQCSNFISTYRHLTTCLTNRAYDIAKTAKQPEVYSLFIRSFPNSMHRPEMIQLLVKNLSSLEKCKEYHKIHPSLYLQIDERAIEIADKGSLELKQEYVHLFPDGQNFKYYNDLISEEARRVKEKEELAKRRQAALKEEKKRKKELAEQQRIEREERLQKERNSKILVRSSINEWTMGDQLCSKTANVIQGVLDQFNEDKSNIKLKIIGGPDITFDGQDIKKGAYIWTGVSQWYECIGDEVIDYNLASENELLSRPKEEAPKSLKEKYVHRLNGHLAGRYAKGLAEKVMWKGHLEDNPRRLNVHIKEWDIIEGKDGSLQYKINTKVTWIENPLFPMDKYVEGLMIINEFGCEATMLISDHNMVYILFSPFTKFNSQQRKDLETIFGRVFKEGFSGECIQ